MLGVDGVSDCEESGKIQPCKKVAVLLTDRLLFALCRGSACSLVTRQFAIAQPCRLLQIGEEFSIGAAASACRGRLQLDWKLKGPGILFLGSWCLGHNHAAVERLVALRCGVACGHSTWEQISTWGRHSLYSFLKACGWQSTWYWTAEKQHTWRINWPSGGLTQNGQEVEISLQIQTA